MVCSPLCGAECWGVCNTLLLLLALQKSSSWVVGFFVFFFGFVSFGPEFAPIVNIQSYF